MKSDHYQIIKSAHYQITHFFLISNKSGHLLTFQKINSTQWGPTIHIIACQEQV